MVVWPEALCGLPSTPRRGSVTTTIPSIKDCGSSSLKTAKGAASSRLLKGLKGMRSPIPKPSMKNKRTEASVVMKQTTLAIKIYFVVKGFQTDPQQLRGASLVVLCLLQRAHDHLTLDLLEGSAHRQSYRVFVTQPLALFDWIWRKVMSFNLFTGANDYCSLDHIPQFTHIAGPGMKLQGT